MLVGQQLGPFVIDKELGSGAMGTVYRGRYTKTGQVVAIKVMAPGLGTTNRHAADRFEREADILKQFNHPHIVRLFGIGRSQGVRFFAMEYIEGESLDKVMARRGRMTWEEVVDLGQQLCAALQHAHEKGVIHRDLKPSNLMILKDGKTLKLTDFGIAKDMDVTQLTSANCTVGTAAYMSPEQCKGERVLTYKSDLYSLGVVFYELLTGRKPFNAENAMDMFLQHVQGAFARPGQFVLDVPVWLDTLVCQLLEKSPDKRPLDAATVAGVLAGIREKVEAQQSAGVEAARRRLVDRPSGAPRPDEADKQAARFLLKGKVRRQKKKKPWFQQVWLHAAGLLLLLLLMAGAFYLVFRPASPDALYAEAERLMKSGDSEKQDRARSGPIQEYLTRYARKLPDDPHTLKIQEWADDADARDCEYKLGRHRQKREGARFAFDPMDDYEKTAFKAVDDEDGGDVSGARTRWQKLQADGPHPWQVTAGRHLRDLDALQEEEGKLARLHQQVRDTGLDRQPEGEVRQAAFRAWRYQKLGDLVRAKRAFDEVAELAGDEPPQHLWRLFAAQHGKQVRERLEERKAEGKKVESAAVVKDRLAAAEALFQETKYPDARAVCLDLLALYEGTDDEEVKALLPKVRELLKACDSNLPGSPKR
jgi:serine/threonine-protein kinase